LHVYGSVSFPLTLDADVLILAGDIHPFAHVRASVKQALENHYKIPVIMVRGNHDYYGGPFDDSGFRLYQVGGFTIGACTLWTDLSNDPFAVLKARQFSDFQWINGLTVAEWQARHDADIDVLRLANPDIIVTHHAPSYRSVSEQFVGEPFNNFFVSNLDEMIMRLSAKIWIHGHVHSHWDYMIGDTKILCNPLGYPNEIKHKVDVKIVEVVK
jgi:predicted phosphodiesterase